MKKSVLRAKLAEEAKAVVKEQSVESVEKNIEKHVEKVEPKKKKKDK